MTIAKDKWMKYKGTSGRAVLTLCGVYGVAYLFSLQPVNRIYYSVLNVLAGCGNLFYVAADGAKSPENRGEKGQEAQNLLCGSDQLPVCLVHGHGISAAESGNDGLRSPGQRDDPDPCAVLKCCRISFCKSVA